MPTISHRAGNLVEVFHDHEVAQAAVSELKSMGFRDSQIEVAFVDREILEEAETEDVIELLKFRTAAGLGVGALVGLGIVSGIVPAIAGGTIGIIISSAVAAATVGGAGTFIELRGPRKGLEVKSGLIVVTVKAGPRDEIACSVLNRFNGSAERAALQAT